MRKINLKQVIFLSLQVFCILIALLVLIILIWAPLTEGKSTNLNLYTIYSDPFILYLYVTAIPFFITLYKLFKLLEYLRQNKIYTLKAVNLLKNIKYCSILFSILIALAGTYIKFFHNEKDDPAGFLAICILAIFISLMVTFISSKAITKLKIYLSQKS